jgi:AraC family transcriptional regulator
MIDRLRTSPHPRMQMRQSLSVSVADAAARTVQAGAELYGVVGSVVTLLEAAHVEIDNNRDAAKVAIARASSLLRRQINRHSDEPSEARKRRALVGWQKQRVRDYVEANLGRRIRVADLSAVAHRSEAHFARAFKRTFDLAPHAYITQRRIEYAQHLMLVTDASLCDIALLCGLSDQAHLCKVFRQQLGMSPAVWRRERSTSAVRSNFAPSHRAVAHV